MSQRRHGGFQDFRPRPRLPVGEDQEVEHADQQDGGVFDQGEGSGAVLGVEADLVLQAFLEEFDGGQVARAQAQTFQVEQLDERDQAQQQGERSDQDGTAARLMRAPVRSGRRAGRSACASAISARAHLAVVGFVIHAQQVKKAVQHQDADFVFEGVPELARLRARTGQPRWPFRPGLGRRSIRGGNESTSVA